MLDKISVGVQKHQPRRYLKFSYRSLSYWSDLLAGLGIFLSTLISFIVISKGSNILNHGTSILYTGPMYKSDGNDVTNPSQFELYVIFVSEMFLWCSWPTSRKCGEERRHKWRAVEEEEASTSGPLQRGLLT